jgi:uncharacterized membrane protein YuzA (DUF378 family)
MTVVMKEKGCLASTIGYYLVIIGALNWGLVGLSDFFGGNFNLVYLIFGRMPLVEAIVYVAVGVAGVMLLVGCKCSTCKACRVEGGEKS